MSKLLVLFGIALGAGVIAVVASPRIATTSNRTHDDGHNAREPSAVELQELRDQVERLRGEMRSARSSQAPDEAPAVAAVAPPTNPNPTSETGVPTRSQEVQAREFERTYQERADRVFFAEARDPQWAPDATLSASLSKFLPQGSVVRSLECRTTFCRVETSHPDPDLYQQFLSAAFGPPPQDETAVSDVPMWRGTTMFVRQNERSERNVRAVAYLAREGYALPAFQERGSSPDPG